LCQHIHLGTPRQLPFTDHMHGFIALNGPFLKQSRLNHV
jgi:hypothetical protein